MRMIHGLVVAGLVPGMSRASRVGRAAAPGRRSRRALSGRSRRRPRRRRRDPGRHLRLDEGRRAGRLAAQVRRRAGGARGDARRHRRVRRQAAGLSRSRSASTASRAASARCGRSSPTTATAIRAALASLPRPGGGTAIGEAMREARPDLYRAGVFRKYLLVVTDGENTTGRSPDDVAREIFRKSEGAVQIYFVAFDTEPGEVRVPEGRRRRRDRRRHRRRAAHGARRHLPGQDPRRGDRRRRAGTRQEVTSS